MIDVHSVICDLKSMSSTQHFEKLSRFGINTSTALGIRVPLLRTYAKKIGKNHNLALELWKTKIHEVQMLASMLVDPKLMSEAEVEEWVCSFSSWDVCDVTCDVLGKTDFVLKLIDNYSVREEEFVKRTAFVLMCELAFHDKKTTNDQFNYFFEIIKREAWDDRNFVRKAVNWALRQIGKRNELLRTKAIACAKRIFQQGTKSATWIAKDALRELNDEKIVKRIAQKSL